MGDLNNKHEIGDKIYRLTEKLFPISRFLTGKGVRESLSIISKFLPGLEIKEVESGKKVFDWTIPEEWEISEAFIEHENGDRIIDFNKNNLHVMAYSDSIDRWMSLDELKKYIYTSTVFEDAIPYVTSYYDHNIGMCMSRNQLSDLKKGNYHLVIDSKRINGSLTYAEYYIPGETKEEILFDSAICHPSLANDELSGVTLAVYIAKEIQKKGRRYSYRFLFMPETIGAINYISDNLTYMQKYIKAGFVLGCEGDDQAYSYTKSILGNTLADTVIRKAFQEMNIKYEEYDYLKRGGNERQYNAPGVDLPVCHVCRTKAEEFPEYHTSRDNLDFVSPEGFQGSFELIMKIVSILECNRIYKSKVLCEPQLGRRGLYSTISRIGSKEEYRRIIDFLAYANGKRDIIEIANILSCTCAELDEVAHTLRANGLISEVL